MRIRTKLGLSFLVTVVALTVTLTWIDVSKTLANSTDEFVYHARQKMELVDGTYQTFLENIRDDVNYLADSELYAGVSNALTTYTTASPKPPVSSLREDAILQFYGRYSESRRQLRSVYFGAEDGGFVGWNAGVNTYYDPRTRPWYDSALQDPSSATVTAPYLTPFGVPMISVAKAVFDANGSLLGVQSVDVTLEHLTDLVKSVRLGRTGYMMLVDQNGTILSDPNNEENLFKKLSDIRDPLYQSLADAHSVSFQVDSLGEIKEVSTYVSEESNWRFITVIDKSEIAGRRWPLIKSMLTASSLMAVLFVALGIYLATTITSPILHVTDSLRKIAEGTADLTQDLKVSSRDEVGTLAMWFNKFLQSAREKQAEHIRTQKLEALGQLSAGVAHEINTPTQYVSDNMAFLSGSLDDLNGVLAAYTELLDVARTAGVNELEVQRFRKIAEDADLDYLLSEIPVAIRQSEEGLDQVKKIVLAMKSFSHPGDEMRPADINFAVENTVTIARNEWKFVAEVALDLDESLPEVTCAISTVNQVLLNLIVNAAHAIETAVEGSDGIKGKISISTRLDGDNVEIAIADTGCGIPQTVRDKIFDPFFTTKEVGKGTGQGLSMAYDTIVNRHGGKLQVDSEPGVGSKFTVLLPSRPVPQDSADFESGGKQRTAC